MQMNAYPCSVPKPGNPLQPLVLARFFLCFRLDLLQDLFYRNIFEADILCLFEQVPTNVCGENQPDVPYGQCMSM